ncbi:putative major tail structural protein [Xanthomonas phage vB_Xar_IVIA-DoCa5]|uniref:Major tail structural protein n=1 Tax=Xanthomonas phage vB_Xar_IVIA-DoCa5 TaxID=2975532 RepID=A0A9X9NYR9_9CAUD|nr:putative major tail structural protein [Xanthomonas phage vB_Xar_IVIA-DoCa5]UYA98692.1 putative major tail structural protein [Xanthomonas phage vB_Xar_IVIA-DoCa5]
MANGSRHSMRYVPEVTYGVTPANPAFKPVRHTGTTLGLSKETLQSEEIRDDRQIADFRHGAYQVGGDMNIELSFGSFDDLLEATLLGTWDIGGSGTPAVAASNTLTLGTQPTAGDTMTIGAVTYTFVAAVDFDAAGEIAIGSTLAHTQQNIRNALEGDDGINTEHPTAVIGVFSTNVATVTAKTAGVAGNSIVTTETFTAGGNVFSSGTLAGGADAIPGNGDVLKAGVTRRSFTIERFFGDILTVDKPYHRFTGVEFNTLALAISANAMVTGTFGVLGQNMTTDTVVIAGATYADPTTTSPLDSFTGTLNEAGTPIAVITEIQLNLENALEARFVVGSKQSIRPSIGRSNCSGTVTAYFENSALLDKFINETESSIVFELPDGAGNKYVITLPRIKYNGGQPDVEGEGPITLSMPFQALLDSVSGTNIIIERIAA